MTDALHSRQLEIRGLTVGPAARHRPAIIEDISLTLTRGRVLALVGASGSGKSTTCSGALGTLSDGLVRRSGEILLDGSTVHPETIRGRIVSTVLQNPRAAFNPLRTMGDHARETLRAIGKDGPDAEEHIRTTLASVGLNDPDQVLKLHAFEMSGGMLQRMMIALALLPDAPFLMADEPTTDLDLVVQMQVLDLLAEARVSRDLGLLLVTHDMGVVARMADEVAVLDQGHVVERAPVAQLFHAPRHPVSQMLVRAHLALYGMETA